MLLYTDHALPLRDRPSIGHIGSHVPIEWCNFFPCDWHSGQVCVIILSISLFFFWSAFSFVSATSLSLCLHTHSHKALDWTSHVDSLSLSPYAFNPLGLLIDFLFAIECFTKYLVRNGNGKYIVSILLNYLQKICTFYKCE